MYSYLLYKHLPGHRSCSFSDLHRHLQLSSVFADLDPVRVDLGPDMGLAMSSQIARQSAKDFALSNRELHSMSLSLSGKFISPHGAQGPLSSTVFLP